MNELIDVANAFTTPLKVAWIVWLAWGLGQVVWYRHQRAHAMASKASARPPRRASTPSPTRQVEPTARMITPAHVEPTRAAAPAPSRRERHQPVAPHTFEHGGANESQPPDVRTDRAAAAFDPSTAIVETFDPRQRGDLDAIVADIERHMPLGRETHVH